MQKIALSIAFASTLLFASAFTPGVASDATPDIGGSFNSPVPAADAKAPPVHAPISWYMCVGKLKLCGPRHIQCGRCN
jgi:hypothetical protein